MCEFLSTIEILSDYTYHSTSTKFPTERNKSARVKLSLDISLRFSGLSLTGHNDDILGKKTPSRGSQINLYTPNLSKGGVHKFSTCFASSNATNSLILHKTVIKPPKHCVLHTVF